MSTWRQFTTAALATMLSAGVASAQGIDPDTLSDDAGIMADFEIPDMVEVRVEHGESLYDLAQMSQVKIEALENINGIDLNTPLKGGQRLVIPMTAEAQTRFQTARQAFKSSRKDAYLARRGGLIEVRSYRVKTGDSAWNIGRSHGRLPVWILKSFNPKANLNRITIGQMIQVPVVGDTQPPETPLDEVPHGDAADPYDEEEQGC